MKNVLFLILLLPVALHAKDRNEPYVRFENGAILFYLPSQSAWGPLLPAYKPGFVKILQTPFFQTQSNQELTTYLTSTIHHLTSNSMSASQKTEFLEKYACLILLNYTRISELDSTFYTTASNLQQDQDPGIKTNSALVVKMVDMYREER